MNDEHIPLAEKLRPKSIDDIIGQDHLVGKNGIIRKLLLAKFLPSIVLWGPPGSGKTTVALLLSDAIHAHFESKSAVTTGLDEVRKIVAASRERLQSTNEKTVLFIDEIHRFNKAQQDALLPHVENGTIIFIGATTENPSFEIISPLLSRCRVLVLKRLTEDHLNIILDRCLLHEKLHIDDKGRTFILDIANGDARILIGIIEVAAELHKSKTKPLTASDIEEAAQRKMLQYDTTGEEHYNTISAFIKSMRASDVDSALYYLARMAHAGEDPLFIARRMVVFASEDIGMAQPTALVVANSVFRACETVGFPECQENLAHGVVYLSLAKKDRSAYDAYMNALHDVEQYGNLPIPLVIRNAPTKLMKDLEYGKGYDKYSKDSHLPDKINGKKYYIK